MTPRDKLGPDLERAKRLMIVLARGRLSGFVATALTAGKRGET
jgi:hypothetical protein